MIELSKSRISMGNLILVNAKYGISGSPVDLVPVGEGCEVSQNFLHGQGGKEAVLLQRQAAVLLERLMAEIDGWKSIVPVSGWRSFEEQEKIWTDTEQESGLEFTKKFVAVPGHSEHQTGLAVDLGLKQENIDFICPEFPYSGICGRFRERAADYGFIERYPAGKEKITGIGHEPWHFRYVGVPHARIMKEQGLTLEEYTSFLTRYPYPFHSYVVPAGEREIHVSYLPAGAELRITEEFPYSISGNNKDGFILTEWRRSSENRTNIRWA